MIDFPASPTNGQTFSASNGVVYKYSTAYTSWLAQNPAPPLGGTGDFSATHGTNFVLTAAGGGLTLNTVLVGNAGLWYSTSTGRYTPPAGRYQISTTVYGANSTIATTINVQIRKNGTVAYTAGSLAAQAGFNGEVTVSGIVDANGSDYFDVFASSNNNTTSTSAYFSAFPLTGMQGPTGNLPAGSLTLYDEQILAAPAASITVAVPTGCKLFEIHYEIASSVGSNDQFNMRAVVSGTPYVTANQNSQFMNGVTSTVGAGLVAAATYYFLNNGIGAWGRIRGSLSIGINGASAAPYMTHEGGSIQVSSRNIAVTQFDGGAARNTITGFQIASNSATNFAIGSLVRSMAVV